MIRRDEWMSYYQGMQPHLFNLAEDPMETHDLARDLAYGRTGKSLRSRFWTTRGIHNG